MSAFIVDVETINRLLGSLCYPGANRSHFYMPDGRYSQECGRDDWQKLGVALHELNIKAVLQRYPNSEHDLPGPVPTPKPRDTVYSPSPVSEVQALKSWECWNYQCSEGDIPETALYKWGEGIIGTLACRIVGDLPEYDAAEWA